MDSGVVFAPLVYSLGFFMEKPGFSQHPELYRSRIERIHEIDKMPDTEDLEGAKFHELSSVTKAVDQIASYLYIYQTLQSQGMTLRSGRPGQQFIEVLEGHFSKAENFPFNVKDSQRVLFEWIKNHPNWTLELLELVEEHWPPSSAKRLLQFRNTMKNPFR